MLGKFALNGYVRQCYRVERTGPNYRVEWHREDVSRICGWINLLKKMRFETTPDVVAVYLMATRQSQFLDPVKSAIESHTGYMGFKGYKYDRIGRTGFSSSDMAEYYGWRSEGTCCCCGCYYSSSQPTPANLIFFPIELYKMARVYQLNRIVRFMDVLTSTYDTYGWGLNPGTRISKKVFNALTAWDPECVESINDMIKAAKSLHASILPSVQLCAEEWERPVREVQKYPSLMWNPVEATLNSHKAEQERVLVTPSIKNKFQSVIELASGLKVYLRETLTKDKDDAFAMDVKEAFCLMLELIVFISACAKNYSGASGFHLPVIDDLNKLKCVSQVEDNGAKRKMAKVCQRCDTEHKSWVFAFDHLSPQAAICLSDIMVNDLKDMYYPHFNEWDLERIKKMFDLMNPQPWGEVLTFLDGEWDYQMNAVRFARNVISQKKTEGEKINV